jgi:hypothetical protein
MGIALTAAGAFIVLLLALPNIGATTLTPTTTWSSLSEGASGLGRANTIAGPTFVSTTLSYSQNSTTGANSSQGMGTAGVTQRAGYTTSTSAVTLTSSYWLNTSWRISAFFWAGEYCFYAAGAGNWTVTVAIQENLFDVSTGRWVSTSNVTSSITLPAGFSSGYRCSSGGTGWSGAHHDSISALNVDLDSLFSVVRGGTYYALAGVRAFTYVDETGLADGYVDASAVISSADLQLVTLDN